MSSGLIQQGNYSFNYEMIFKILSIILLIFYTKCNVTNDIYEKSDGRGDDYAKRKCFIECVERRVAVNPLPKPTDYYDACWPVYVLGCSN